ncbi:hypothetical protein BGX38DRAFT_757744 [Terfezia claveryi]|nr:hypothetical protein BGX38DRAFT_757744 [Terfezia claveryi]
MPAPKPTSAEEMSSRSATGSVRVISVCGGINIEHDIFFFRDFILLWQLLPRLQDEMWLVCKDINKQKYRANLALHGHPRADRVVINTPDTPLDWVIKTRKRRLKSRFLHELRQRGGGEDEVGGIAIGTKWSGTYNFLAPSEVFEIIEQVQGSTTVILNSCFSGIWVKSARERNLGCGSYPSISIIARCEEEGEILSFPDADIPGEHENQRGGYFINSVANQIYSEYGIFFPRPPIATGVIGEQNIYTNPFPPSNIQLSARAARTKTTTLCNLIRAVQSELRIMVGDISIPQFSVAPNLSALEAIRPNLVLRLDSTVPPASGAVGQSVPGLLEQRHPKTTHLVRLYQYLPNTPRNTGGNVPLSVCIGKFLRNISTAAERRELRLGLLARLGTYNKAVECAKLMRIIEFWPAEYPGPGGLRDKANELTKSASWVTAYTLTRERWGTCWRVPTVLLACAIVNSGIPLAQLNRLRKD